MKRLFIIAVLLILTCACTNINKLEYKDIVDTTINKNKNNKMYNHFGNGYKYYLPKNMSIKNIYNYNELLNGGDTTYYLYVDIISYYNKNNKKNDNCSIKYQIHNDVDGYLCIEPKNNKYLVEIVYNYAKIEVIVDDYNLKEAVNNSIIILSTIKYDDDIIKNMIIKNKIGNNEETLDIFKDKKSKVNFIDVVEEYDTYEEELPDYDVIN